MEDLRNPSSPCATENMRGSMTDSTSEFDYLTCPRCELGMRLAFVEPRRLHREDAYERHLYRCGGCGNDSHFVFELPSHAREWQGG
jgi:DNA-directed RNA polymerase subunit RPC12/RpoP